MSIRELTRLQMLYFIMKGNKGRECVQISWKTYSRSAISSNVYVTEIPFLIKNSYFTS